MFRACVKAEAATLLTVFEVLGLLNSFEALEATVFDVDSFFDFAIFLIFKVCNKYKVTTFLSCQTMKYTQAVEKYSVDQLLFEHQWWLRYGLTLLKVPVSLTGKGVD